MLKRRIVAIFLLTLSLLALPAGAGEMPASPQKSNVQKEAAYPPYSDVWDWKIPESDKSLDPSATPSVRVKAMDNGDVLITYEPDLAKAVVKYVTFFGKSVVTNPAEIYKNDYTNDAKSRIPFKDGNFLKTIGGGMRSYGCVDQLRFHIAIYDKTELKLISNKTLLYIFDKPEYYETKPPVCMDGPSFYYRVRAVAAGFLPLKDGTFLLVSRNGDGHIIRFDENFQTKSKLMNNKFFWMDTDELSRFEAKYGDRADGDKNLKQLYADLYELLMNRKRREIE